jgi:uncharacterized protein YceK
MKAIAKEEALAEAKRNYGFFALLSNEIKDPVEALEIYRNKDLVEKAFDNLKERLNLRRVAVSSEQSLDGKLFVQFIALIFLSYITKKMQENKLFKDYTLQEILDELDVIEFFEVPGQQRQVGEITKRQIDFYAKHERHPSSLYNNSGTQVYNDNFWTHGNAIMLSWDLPVSLATDTLFLPYDVYRNTTDTKPLVIAVQQNSLNEVKALLKNGANPNDRYYLYYTSYRSMPP